MIVMALLLAVSTASCLNNDDDEEDEAILETAESTGLCGVNWVLTSIIEGETTTTDVPHDTYVFDLSGEGYHEYTDDDGVQGSVNFTWNSYYLNVNLHELVIRLEGDGYDQYTYYAIDANGYLRIMTVNSYGITVIYEYEAR